MVGSNIGSLLKPVLGNAVENLAFEGDGSEHVIKRALTIRCYENAPVGEQVHVAHFSLFIQRFPLVETRL